MAKVDCEINLIWLGYVKLSIPFLFHKYCHKFIADFWRVLCIVCEAKLLLLHSLSKLGLFFDLEVFAFDFLGPA